MNKLKTYNNFINEGVRDMMTPKSEEDIKKSIGRKGPKRKIEIGIRNDMPDLVRQALTYAKERNYPITSDELAEFINDAETKNSVEIIEILLQYGAKKVFYYTLMDAVKNNKIDIVNLFIKYNVLNKVFDDSYTVDGIVKNIKETTWKRIHDTIKLIIDNTPELQKRLKFKKEELSDTIKIIDKFV